MRSDVISEQNCSAANDDRRHASTRSARALGIRVTDRIIRCANVKGLAIARIIELHMAKKTTVQSVPQSFELAVAELESILGAMEGDQIGLEESLVKYERGTFLLQWCRGVLGEAEKKIQLISQGAAGKLSTEPLEAGEEEV